METLDVMRAQADTGPGLPRYRLYIDGAWREPASGEYFLTENPFTCEAWAEVARGGPADIADAVAAAKAAQPAWGGLPGAERRRLLLRVADLIDAAAPRLGEIDCRDNGKTYSEMLHQSHYVAEWFRYFAGLADKVQGSVVPPERPNFFNFTTYEPLGVIGMITPWNSPLLLLANKLAPALAAGNTAVIKPSEFTSAGTLEFAALFTEAGIPPGVVNVVSGFGPEAGAALVQHPDVAKVAFTGSEAGGRRIYEAAARDLKKVSLELGGKSPNIIFEDADLEAAAMGALGGVFSAAGQACVAGSRLLLQRSVYDQVLARMIEVASEARLGDPMAADTDIGPIANPPQYRKVLEYIAIAKAEGATCALGGEPSPAGPLFVKPTIFTGVSNTMRIAREEVFGPVLSVIPFETEAEAFAIANDTPYGLAAGVWTGDIGRAIRATREVRAGMVWVNTYRTGGCSLPFGGFKHSGLGREGGVDAVRSFMDVKTVIVSLDPSAAKPFGMR